MAEEAVPVIFDVKPGPGKRAILIPMFIAAVITGIVWSAYGLLDYNFAFGIQLFAVALGTVMIVPPIFAATGLSKYSLVQSLVQAGIISAGTAAVLVAQRIWVTPSGNFELTVLFTGASITISVVAFVIAYLTVKFKIEL